MKLLGHVRNISDLLLDDFEITYDHNYNSLNKKKAEPFEMLSQMTPETISIFRYIAQNAPIQYDALEVIAKNVFQLSKKKLNTSLKYLIGNSLIINWKIELDLEGFKCFSLTNYGYIVFTNTATTSAYISNPKELVITKKVLFLISFMNNIILSQLTYYKTVKIYQNFARTKGDLKNTSFSCIVQNKNGQYFTFLFYTFIDKINFKNLKYFLYNWENFIAENNKIQIPIFQKEYPESEPILIIYVQTYDQAVYYHETLQLEQIIGTPLLLIGEKLDDGLGSSFYLPTDKGLIPYQISMFL